MPEQLPPNRASHHALQGRYNDCFPYSGRAGSPADLLSSDFWPMQLLHYLGGYQNVEPAVYICPNERNLGTNGYPFRLHYWANRSIFRDVGNRNGQLRAAQIRSPAKYWTHIEKFTTDSIGIRASELGISILLLWNSPTPGGAFAFPQLVRHNGGTSSTAADGHVEWLRLPPYQPGAPSPLNFLELGDCANGSNPPSTWPNNGGRVKLFSRETSYGFVGGPIPF